jgi:hypothetical protein
VLHASDAWALGATPSRCPEHPTAEAIPWSMRHVNWSYLTIAGVADHLRKNGIPEEAITAVVLDYAEHQNTALWPELPPEELALAALRWLRWGRGPLPEQVLPPAPANAPGLFGPKQRPLEEPLGNDHSHP